MLFIASSLRGELLPAEKIDSLRVYLHSLGETRKNMPERIAAMKYLASLQLLYDGQLAEKTAKQTLVLGDKFGIPPEQEQELYYIIGRSHYYRMEYMAAIDSYMKAYTILIKNDLMVKSGFLLIDIGNTYYMLGNKELPIVFYQRAIQSFRKENELYGISVAFNNIGIMEHDLGRQDIALYYYRRALLIRESLKSTFSIAHSNSLIGNQLVEMNRINEGRAILFRAQNQMRTIPNMPHQGSEVISTWYDILYSIGKSYQKEGNYSKALSWYLPLLNYNDRILGDVLKLKVYQRLSELELGRNTSQSVIYAREAVKLADRAGTIQDRKDTYYSLAMMFLDMGKNVDAKKWILKYHAVSDSILIRQQSLKFSEVSTALSTLIRERENELLRNQKRTTIIVYSGVVAFLTLLLIILICSLRSRREQERRLKRLVNSSFEGIILHIDDRIIDYNQRFAELVCTDGEINNKMMLSDFIPKHCTADYSNCFRDNSGITSYLLDSRKTLIPVDVLSNSFIYKGKSIHVTVFRDKRWQLEKEAQLKVQEEFRRKLITTIPDTVIITDLSGCIQYTSDSALGIVGMDSVDELLGKNIVDFMLEDDKVEATKNLQTRILENAGIQEYKIQRLDGVEITIEVNASLLHDEEESPSGFVILIRDVTERNKTQETLLITTKQAEVANIAKSEFIAQMSHEIRTPMSGILGLTELTLETELTDLQRSYLSGVYDSANSLMSVVNDILDFSKMEANKIVLESGSFDIWNLIESAMQVMFSKAREKGIGLSYRISLAVPRVWEGDAIRIRQIVLNLISNAVKYTIQGKVKLTVSYQSSLSGIVAEKGFYIIIDDSGVGIPQNARERIFERFEQAKKSDTRVFGGTGLGLAITKHLVELMEGSIELSSEMGVGSTFECYLPLSSSMKSNFVYDLGEPEMLKSYHECIILEPISVERNSRGIYAKDFDSVSGRILVAEDNKVNRQIIQGIIKDYPLQVYFAENGREAVDIFTTQKFDLIFMDIHMPELNGMQATKMIREYTEGASIPIIALTADAMQGDKEKYLELGITEYISKPFKKEQIEVCLKRYLPKEIFNSEL